MNPIEFFIFVGSSAPLRSVCLSHDKKNILVGTQTCEILQFNKKNNKTFCQAEANSLSENDLILKSMASGHFKNELWGLATRPETHYDG